MRTLVLIASCLAAASAGAAELPFQVVTNPFEIASLTGSGAIATPLTQTTFTTAASYSVQKGSSLAVANGMRGANAMSSLYNLAKSAGISPPAVKGPPGPVAGQFVNYNPYFNGDAVQAWATMTEQGKPLVQIYADGKTQAQANASWATQYTVTGTGTRDVYVQFTVPAVTFQGRWEDDAPTLSRARVRVNFLVNGFPAWSTEVVRFNETYYNQGIKEKQVYLESFGNDIGVAAIDTQNATSTARKITMKLGSYPANKTFDFSLLFQVESKLDGSCASEEGAPDYDCGGMSVKFAWDPNGMIPTFYTKTPAL